MAVECSYYWFLKIFFFFFGFFFARLKLFVELRLLGFGSHIFKSHSILLLFQMVAPFSWNGISRYPFKRLLVFKFIGSSGLGLVWEHSRGMFLLSNEKRKSEIRLDSIFARFQCYFSQNIPWNSACSP